MKKQFYTLSTLPDYALPIFKKLIEEGKIQKNFCLSDTVVEIVISKFNRGEFD